jgi:hypothetical protein
MNWEALGAIGEIVGAAAVVFTLGYLAVQIRQSGNSSRQQSYNDLVTRRADFYNKMIESADVAEVVIAGGRGDKLDTVTAQRYTSAMLNYVSHFQDVYLQRERGLIEESVWRAERQYLAVMFGLPGFVAWWEPASQYFLPEFVAYVKGIEPIPVVIQDQASGKWIHGTW